jgi:hypothetical protein
MTPAQRTIKRIVIILVYLIIFGGIGTGLYFLFRTAPTCADNIQNQGEEGVDCGGPCAACEKIPVAQNLQVIEKAIVPGETGKYDVLARVTNPNPQLGAASFDYTFSLLDDSGQIISQSSGTGFILPGQTKYVLAFNIESQTMPTGVDFQIKSFEWSKFTQFESPNISVSAKEFSLAGGGEPGFARLTAKVRNQSNYDFHKITVNAVVRDKAGNPIAVNTTNLNDVLINEEREVNFSWSSPFPIDPMSARIEVVPEADVFGSDNYMKQHGSVGQYGTYNTDNQQ